MLPQLRDWASPEDEVRDVLLEKELRSGETHYRDISDITIGSVILMGVTSELSFQVVIESISPAFLMAHISLNRDPHRLIEVACLRVRETK